MTPTPHRMRHLWWLAPLAAVALLGLTHRIRLRAGQQVTDQPVWSIPAIGGAANSPTGYADGRRPLIAPDASGDTYEWIMQAQQAWAARSRGLHHVDYDNAPAGRATRKPALYRAWVLAVALAVHVCPGRAVAPAIESAALLADPLLQLLLLAGVTLHFRRRHGRAPAALAALFIAAAFPLATVFAPGILDANALGLLCLAGAALPLISACAATPAAPPATAGPFRRFDFGAAGVAAGLGLWVSPFAATLTIAGLGLGGIGAAFCLRTTPTEPARPWRLWALAGILTALVAAAVETGSGAGGFLHVPLHPAGLVAWLGSAELITQLARIIRRPPAPSSRRPALVAGALALVVAGAAFWLLREARPAAGTAGDPRSLQLTAANGGLTAPDLAVWLVRDGFSSEATATLLVLLAFGPAVAALARKSTPPARRAAMVVALGPALVVTAAAVTRLQLWSLADLLWLGVLGATFSRPPDAADRGSVRRGRAWSAAALAGLAGSVVAGWPPRVAAGTGPSVAELQAVITRDLACWLSARSGPGTTVLAPPDLTMALCYHGSLRGVGSLAPDNDAGLSATLRIASALTAREARTLLRQRQVDYVILPSWDSMLDDLARVGTSTPDEAFVSKLHRWDLPGWLQPLPYTLPRISGTEPPDVAVFQIVDDTDDATALSRLAEYFLETGRREQAAAARTGLQRYRATLSALVAIAEIDFAAGDRAEFAGDLKRLTGILKAGADRNLTWDRRVSLAIVLAQGREIDLATAQVRRCAEQVTAERLRSLTAGALYRFLLLSRAARVDLPDPGLRADALRLLPPELARRVTAGGA